jgi:hypothetical protein
MSEIYMTYYNSYDNKISRSYFHQEKIRNHVMKTRYFSTLLLTMCLISFPSFSQTENDTPLLGLPGDDLDLYAVLNIFQKSKTIEGFEKELNGEKAGIVNLDLNNDGKVDFINVKTEQDGDDFLFILQDPINEKETQDVAVIAVSKNVAGEISLQIIGDKDLYGKDYVIEPRTEPTESVTSNPAYVGDNPVTVNVLPTTEVIVVQSAPIVQYVYSPAYVPYYPPYYYGAPYAPYFRAAAVVSIGIYHHNNYHHHHNYHGGHGDVNINVNRQNNFNNYDRNTRNSSNTVKNNVQNGNFKTSGQGGSRPSNRASTGNNRASTGNNRASTGNNRASSSNRSTSPNSSNRSSASRSMGSSRSSSASRSPSRSYSGGAGRSGGGRSGGGGRRR